MQKIGSTVFIQYIKIFRMLGKHTFSIFLGGISTSMSEPNQVDLLQNVSIGMR